MRFRHRIPRFSAPLYVLMSATFASASARATLGQSAAATPPRAHSAVHALAHVDKLDEYIEAVMLEQHIPGLSLAVVQDGKVVKSKAYGLANTELNLAATTGSVYQIQSITKSFIACGIMLLAGDGKIGLDDTITKYLSPVPQAWSEVTVRQLLTHTSGIPSFVQDQGSGAAIIAFAEKTDSSEQIIRWAATRPLKFAPGEGRKYTSTGYHLLGMIIENVTGKPTFTPAIMESAAGGLVSTVEDLAR